MTEPGSARSQLRRGPLLITALVATGGGSLIYLAALPSLWRMSWPYGLLFAVLGMTQVAAMTAVLARPLRRRVQLTAAAAVVVLVLWIVARIGLLPAPNPWVATSWVIGFVDALCAGLEATAVIGLGVVAALPPRERRSRARRVAAALAVLPLALVVLLGTVIGVAGSSDGFAGAGAPADVAAPRDVTAARVSTVEYCRPDAIPLAMDLSMPAARRGPAPLVLYVHGGGFVLGDRQPTGFGNVIASHDGALFIPLRQQLNARGFVVASIDYRLPPATAWPAQIEDAKCAVRFLRAHATDLGIDPSKIGVWGSSAGAQLACLLGLVGPAAGFDGGQYADQSSAVQAVVDMFGCIDLNDIADSSPVLRVSIQLALGSSETVRNIASPGGYIAPGAPPFLVLQGTADPSVRPRHSTALVQQLHAAGVPATLIEVQGAGHSLATPGQQPAPEQLITMVADFFTSDLR